MKARIIFAMVCFVTGSAAGQNQREIDSLMSALKIASQEDSVLLYHDLAIHWFGFDRNKSLGFNKLEYKHSCELGDSVRILRSLRLMGQIFRNWREYDSAESILVPLIPIAMRLGLSDELLYLYMSLGGVYLNVGRYDQCIRLYSDALELPEIEKEEQQDIKTIILFNLGTLYYKIRDNDRALAYDFITLERLRKAGDPRHETPQLLANVSLCYIFKHDFENAERYLKQAQEECGQKCHEHLRMQLLFNYGMLFLEQKTFDKAEEFLMKSFPIAIRQNDLKFQLDHIERLVKIYIDQRRFTEAQRLLIKADAILSTHTFNSEAEKIYWQSMRLYKAIGDIEQLAMHQERYLQTHDSVYNTTLRVNVAQAEVEYQQREAAYKIKNREELIVLKDSLIDWQRVVIMLSLITVGLVTLLLIISIKRSRSRRNANFLLEEKVKERTAGYNAALTTLSMELRSHKELSNKLQSETFNAMTAIAVLCSLGNDDPENRAIYFQDINKLSLRVMQHMDGVVTNSTT